VSLPTRMMWNGTVKGLSFRDQIETASAAGCGRISVTPSDYNRWLGNAQSTRDLKTIAADNEVSIRICRNKK